MKNICGNIYAAPRKIAGLSQESAADLLNVSIRSLTDYETGRTLPPDDVVCGMVELYSSKLLAYMHFKINTDLGRKYLPEIQNCDLSQTVIKFYNEVDNSKGIMKDMFDIASDGRINADEVVRWNNVTKVVNKLVSVCLTVIFQYYYKNNNEEEIAC